MWFWKKKEVVEHQVPNRRFVSIRMEAIGGQGANSAGKILAETAVLAEGYNGNHFSSFGSEKRGSPVKSYVRFSTQGDVIRTASAIQNPNILVIFHEGLLGSHPEILDGANDETDLLINSASHPEDLRFPKGMKFRNIATLNAIDLAHKSQCGLNAVMLGAIGVLCSEVRLSSLQAGLQRFFESRGPKVVHANALGFLAGANSIKIKPYHERQSNQKVEQISLPELGWLNAPIGGVITNPGNSILKDHSASRKGIAPKFIKEICFNCGFCDMVCPDFCFVWELDANGTSQPKLKGIDYQYCKGCQKCVAVCPVEALQPVLESEIKDDERQHKVFPNVSLSEVNTRAEHLNWTTFVDQLSDQDRMGTIQTELLDRNSYLRPSFSTEIIERSKEKKK